MLADAIERMNKEVDILREALVDFGKVKARFDTIKQLFDHSGDPNARYLNGFKIDLDNETARVMSAQINVLKLARGTLAEYPEAPNELVDAIGLANAAVADSKKAINPKQVGVPVKE